MDTIFASGFSAYYHLNGSGRLGRPHIQDRLLSTDPTELYAASIIHLRLGTWLVHSLKLGFYALFPNVSAEFKITRIASPPPRPLRVLALSLLNVIVVTAVEIGLAFGLKYATGTCIFSAPPTLPSVWKMITHVIILMLIRKALAACVHAGLLHDASTSPMLTELHLRWAHGDSYIAGHPYTEHPILLLVRHLAPALLASLVFRPHLATHLVFTTIYAHESVDTSSGYPCCQISPPKK